jgi:hypothetical protein
MSRQVLRVPFHDEAPRSIRDARSGQERPWVRPHEAGLVLRCPERVVGEMLDRGELRPHWAGRFRRVSAESLIERLSSDALASLVLRAILAGELRIPKPSKPADPPVSLIWALSRIP